MTALSALRAKAADRYPDYLLELDDGTRVTLVSVMRMSDLQLTRFSDVQRSLQDADESDDLDAVRWELIDALASVSTAPETVRDGLCNETLGTLTIVFTEYSESASAGAKSEVTS